MFRNSVFTFFLPVFLFAQGAFAQTKPALQDLATDKIDQTIVLEIPTVTPEQVGMSSKELARIDERMKGYVDKGLLAGGIVMIARHGKIAYFKDFGMMDIAAKKPMTKDAIMRFYSMTKAITTAAAMMLVDEKKLALDDPVSKYIPEMKDLKVFGKEGNFAPENEMTVRDLMRHTAGFGYGSSGNKVLDQQFHKLNILDRNSTLKLMTTKLSKMPLVYSPGTDWMYSVSVDVLGRVVEVVAEQSLDQFFRERIFDPLNMKDTGFFVPKDKVERFAVNYHSNRFGKLTVKDDPLKSRYLKNPKFFSGGGGLVSTARDYMRFLLMIANQGELNGTRILSEKSVSMMTRNQLPKEVGWVKFGDTERKGVGFGLGFSVRAEMSKWDSLSRVGEYGWGGKASTHYWLSPTDDLIVIALEQTEPYSFLTEFGLKGIIYDAIKN